LSRILFLGKGKGGGGMLRDIFLPEGRKDQKGKNKIYKRILEGFLFLNDEDKLKKAPKKKTKKKRNFIIT
jgi:hypothetical protein